MPGVFSKAFDIIKKINIIDIECYECYKNYGVCAKCYKKGRELLTSTGYWSLKTEKKIEW